MALIVQQMPLGCNATSMADRTEQQSSETEEIMHQSVDTSDLLSEESAELDAALDLVQHMANTLQHSRTRLRKRHSHNHYFFQNNLAETATELEWQNTCNGDYDASAQSHSQQRPPVRHVSLLCRY